MREQKIKSELSDVKEKLRKEGNTPRMQQLMERYNYLSHQLLKLENEINKNFAPTASKNKNTTDNVHKNN